MKNHALLLVCLAASLAACDSTSVIGPGSTVTDTTTDTSATDDNATTAATSDDSDTSGEVVVSTESETSADTGTSGASGGTSTGLDGITTSQTSNGLVNSVGLIKLEPLGVSTDSTRGLFGDLSETLTEQEIRDWYMPPTDTCTVTIISEEVPGPEFLVVDQAATLVSAGNSVVLTDDNGTYATLPQMTGQTGPVYLPEANIDQPAGPNLSVDISGEQFAAFPGIAVPEVPALELSNPASGANVNVSTFFQWQPNDVPGSLIEVYTSGVSSVSNEAIFIGCAVMDDGVFAFPAEVQALMGAGYDDEWTTLLRVVYNVAAEDDTLVFVANSVRAE